MKEFIKKVPTPSIILTIVAVLLIIWGAQQMTLGNGGAIFNDAVNVKCSQYSEENEGKSICVSGKITVDKAPADMLTGVTAEGVILRRVVSMYQYTISETDTVIKEYLPYQQENIEGDGGESYENPVFPEGLESAVILADASVGEYTLGEKYLYALDSEGNTYISKEYEFVAYEGELTEFDNEYGLKASDGCYTNQKSDTPEIGDIKISYEYLPADSLPEISFFGTQKNGSIGADTESENGYMSDTMETVEEMKEGVYGDFSEAGKGMFVIAVILVAIAVFLYFRKNKKEGGAV